eukprot:2096833-Rhodomonas_salina.1
MARTSPAHVLYLASLLLQAVSSSNSASCSQDEEHIAKQVPNSDSQLPCPRWGTDRDHLYCSIWKESVGSIPYDVPWTEENKHLLRDRCVSPSSPDFALCPARHEFWLKNGGC